MSYDISKALSFLALPSNLVILIGIAGALLLPTRFRRAGWVLIVMSLLLLAVIGFSPVGNALIKPLEGRFSAYDHARGEPVGIVVLGGAIDPETSHAHQAAALNEAAERIVSIAELARRYPKARIVFTGGGDDKEGKGPTEADYALRLFESFGVPRDRVTLETKAHNTAENAAFSKAVAKPNPGELWLLVTSAHHMPRAVGAFRQAGFPVIAYPVDWRVGTKDDANVPNSLADGLKRCDTAVREWIGLLVYWLTGRSSELFPGPAPAKAAGAPKT